MFFFFFSNVFSIPDSYLRDCRTADVDLGYFNFKQMRLELLKDPRGFTKAKWGAGNFQDALSYAEKTDSNFF